MVLLQVSVKIKYLTVCLVVVTDLWANEIASIQFNVFITAKIWEVNVFREYLAEVTLPTKTY